MGEGREAPGRPRSVSQLGFSVCGRRVPSTISSRSSRWSRLGLSIILPSEEYCGSVKRPERCWGWLHSGAFSTLRAAIARPSGCAFSAPPLERRRRSDTRSSARPPPPRMKFCQRQAALFEAASRYKVPGLQSVALTGGALPAQRGNFCMFSESTPEIETRWRRGVDLNRRDPSFRTCFRAFTRISFLRRESLAGKTRFAEGRRRQGQADRRGRFQGLAAAREAAVHTYRPSRNGTSDSWGRFATAIRSSALRSIAFG
jgi:hypothetical protein